MSLVPRQILVLICGFLPAIGCHENRRPDQPVENPLVVNQPANLPRNHELNQAEITEIAIQMVVNKTRLPSQQLEADASMQDDGWSVWVIRNGPEASPGDHWLFTIDRYGVVTEFYLGM